ncbi:MAG: hypothetical protein ABJC63_05105 [Gemmatimonadales bacterium]
MNRMARSTISLVALLLVTGLLLSLGFRTDADRHALIASGVLAAVVQMSAFTLVHIAGKTNALAAWGLGTIFRGTVLAFYGFFLVKMLALPLTAALVSFAVFLFVSMLLESLLLAYDA